MILLEFHAPSKKKSCRVLVITVIIVVMAMVSIVSDRVGRVGAVRERETGTERKRQRDR